MNRLIIIGAGGFGREVLTWALDNPDHNRIWQVAGFLDSRTGILDGFAKDADALPQAAPHDSLRRAPYRRDFPILGDPLTYTPGPEDVFLCALGDSIQRHKYASAIRDKGGRFAILMHPKAEISTFATLGEGSIIGPFASLSPDSHIGSFVVINSYTAVAHDAVVEDWATVAGHSLVAGNARIGEAAQVHGGSIITPGAKVGARAVVGAGSVVVGRIPDGVTVMGNPARRFDWRKPS